MGADNVLITNQGLTPCPAIEISFNETGLSITVIDDNHTASRSFHTDTEIFRYPEKIASVKCCILIILSVYDT